MKTVVICLVLILVISSILAACCNAAGDADRWFENLKKENEDTNSIEEDDPDRDHATRG